MKIHHSTISYIFFGVIVLLGLFGISTRFALAGPVAPLTGPTAEPSGTTPQQKFYHPLVTLPSGNQSKAGKLGIDGAPAPEYDFKVQGHASFLGGIWASVGVFLQGVCIGTPPTSNGICPGGGNNSLLKIFGTFQSIGADANIQNDFLKHNTELPNGYPALERVCSGTTGKLQLCSAGTLSTPTTGAGAGSTSSGGSTSGGN